MVLLSDPTWFLLVDCEPCGYPITAAGAQAFQEARAHARTVSGGILSRAQLDAVHIHANRVEREAEAVHRRDCPAYAALRDRMEAKAARTAQRGRQKRGSKPSEGSGVLSAAPAIPSPEIASP